MVILGYLSPCKFAFSADFPNSGWPNIMIAQGLKLGDSALPSSVMSPPCARSNLCATMFFSVYFFFFKYISFVYIRIAIPCNA